MHNNLVAAAIGVTVGVLSAASIFIYRKILSNQQYATTISDLDSANKRIEELQAELETLRLQLKQRKKQRRLRKLNSNDSSYTLTYDDTDVDVFSTDTDVGDDEFYDCSDGESISSENDMRISEELHQLDSILKEIDDHVNEEFDIKTYYKLQALIKYNQDNVELVWRFARACYDYAVVQTDENAKRVIILHGIEVCEQILENRHAELFKWYAILIGLNGSYLSTADKMKNGVKFKTYVTMALEMKPNDFELHYLLGRFKYEIASLNWLEKKAATLFSEIPNTTYEEALQSFQTAAKLGNKNPQIDLYISKCYIALKQYSCAMDTIKEILGKQILTSDDETVHTEASKLFDNLTQYCLFNQAIDLKQGHVRIINVWREVRKIYEEYLRKRN